MKKIVVIDNYDSFTYNLVYYIESITKSTVDVFRNDEVPLDKLKDYDKILISPGPGIPAESGICPEIITEYSTTKSILGICLGHQAIAQAFGGLLINLDSPFHGIMSDIHILTDDPLFRKIPKTIKAGRYHSWIVDKNTLPHSLEINSEDTSGLIMGVSHRQFDVRGLQFHPESIMTGYGYHIMKNWIRE